jgi:Protein of unknown function (DUF3592)
MNDLTWLQDAGVGLFFLIGAFLCIVPGLLIFWSSYLKMHTWMTVSGTVIGYNEVQQGRHRDAQGKMDKSANEPIQWTAYDPQVQFISADGKTITFTSPMGSNRKSYRIGDVVQVLYDPEGPENAAIKSFSRLFLVPIIVTAAGLVLLGIAICTIIQKRHG